MKTMSASKFKAACLGVIDRVERTGNEVVITKRGRPVARLVPLQEKQRTLEGSVLAEDDLITPTGETWTAS